MLDRGAGAQDTGAGGSAPDSLKVIFRDFLFETLAPFVIRKFHQDEIIRGEVDDLADASTQLGSQRLDKTPDSIFRHPDVITSVKAVFHVELDHVGAKRLAV
jgi:hypothetical protein